nr:HAD hydrolase-like protein [uncultured Desulfobacter sp.]
MIENIFFDLDGTLTDPKEGITRCIQFTLEAFGVKKPHADELTWCIGPPLRDSFAKILKTTDKDKIELAYITYRERFAKKGLYENRVYAGVHSCLDTIQKSGFKTFLATSKPEIYAKRILDHFDLSTYFTKAYGSHLDGSLTDKGELIAHMLKIENLAPQKTVIVGDRVFDIEGGKQNGIMTAGVTYGYGSRDEITLSKPDVIFDAFSDLLSFLDDGQAK